MTTSQEDDGKLEGNPKPIKESENKSDDIKAQEDLEDEEDKDERKHIIVCSTTCLIFFRMILYIYDFFVSVYM